MDIQVEVVLHRTDIYPCQTCPAAFLCQDELNQHTAKHNNIFSNKSELKYRTGYKHSSLGLYDRSFATRTVPVNKKTGCRERKKDSKNHISIGEYKSNYDVNKEDVESKKKQKLGTDISIEPEYAFLTIKTEPQLKTTYSTNFRNKIISKPPPDRALPEFLKSDVWKETQLKERKITRNSNNQYSCGQCTQSFRTLTDIKSHLETHLDPSFACDKCPESFNTLRQLNRHSLLTHSSKRDIKCNICQKILKTNRNLRLHQLIHTGEKPFPCKQCGKRFTQSGSLQMHMKIHLGLKEHVCEYCNKAFTEYKNMKNHERTHTKERPFGCRFCGKRFGDSSALIRHIRIHTGKKIYECQQCHMKFSDPSGLTAHKKRHSGVKTYVCDFCDKKFTTKHILANHESSERNKADAFAISTAAKQYDENSETFKIPATADHEQCKKPECDITEYDCESVKKSQETKDNEKTETAICIQLKRIEINTVQTKTKPSKFNTKSKSNSLTPNFLVKQSQKAKQTIKKQTRKDNTQYACGQCPKTYASLAGMRSHLASHFEPPFLCSKCPESFPTLTELNGHKKSTHSSKNEIRCHKCDKILKNNRNLRVHLQTHTGERPFPCNLCGKRFTQSASLFTHTKIHLGLKEHVCSYCKKAFTERKNMRNHERTHTKERPFECRYCFKGFGDPSALTRHVRIHTGDKIYHCQVCHMKFSEASGLISHRKRHDDIKKLACDFCGKQFSTHQMLYNHESSIHMNIKNFQCDICNKSFSLKQYLKSHIQRNHMDSVECSICGMKFFSKTHLQIHKSMGCVKDKFTCDLCGAKFSLKRFVKKHMEKKYF